jgi:uncharacterized protein YjbI with pentapeptide repeats
MSGRRDFTKVDLTGADLNENQKLAESFNKYMVSKCFLRESEFFSIFMKGQWRELSSSDVLKAMKSSWDRIKLNRIYLSYGNLKHLRGYGLFIPAIHMLHSYLDNTDLSGCFFTASEFDGSEMPSSRFADTDLRMASMRSVSAPESDFSGARMQRIKLNSSRFNGSNFKMADLSLAEFEETDFSDCDFSGAVLLKVKNLVSANWKNAKFGRTKATKEDIEAILRKRDVDELDPSTSQQREVRRHGGG